MHLEIVATTQARENQTGLELRKSRTDADTRAKPERQIRTWHQLVFTFGGESIRIEGMGV